MTDAKFTTFECKKCIVDGVNIHKNKYKYPQYKIVELPFIVNVSYNLAYETVTGSGNAMFVVTEVGGGNGTSYSRTFDTSLVVSNTTTYIFKALNNVKSITIYQMSGTPATRTEFKRLDF